MHYTIKQYAYEGWKITCLNCKTTKQSRRRKTISTWQTTHNANCTLPAH